MKTWVYRRPRVYDRRQRRRLPLALFDLGGGSGLTFYLKDATASGSNHLSLQQGGTPPATATTGTGWTVGTTASGNYALLDSGTERSAASFGGTVLPGGTGPNNTLGDCFRSENRITGSFANANWTIVIPVIAVTSGGDQDGRFRMRLWRGPNADGSGATDLFTSDAQTSDATNLGTGSAQTPGASVLFGAATFENEYLFLQVAWEVTGAGGASDRDVLLRVGSDAKISTASFTAGLTANLPPVVLTLAGVAPTGQHAAATGVGTVVIAAVAPAARHTAAAGIGTITLAAVSPAARHAAAAGVGVITFSAPTLAGSGEHPLPVVNVTLAAATPATRKAALGGLGTLTIAGVAAGARHSASLPAGNLALAAVSPVATKRAALAPVSVTFTAGAFGTGITAAAGLGAITIAAASLAARKRAALPVGTIQFVGVRPTTIGGLGAKFPDACTLVDVGWGVELVQGGFGVTVEE